MGRHTAEIRLPLQGEIASDRVRRASPPTAGPPDPATHTQPDRFGAGPAPLGRTAALGRPLPGPAGPRPYAESWAQELRPAGVGPRPLQARSDIDPAVAAQIQRDLRTIRPPALAPRASTSGLPEPHDRSASPALPPAQRILTAPVSVPSAERAPTTAANGGDGPESDTPTGFRVRRTLALAACAVAVLGAVSGAAALLPDGSTGGAAGAAVQPHRPSVHPVSEPGTTP